MVPMVTEDKEMVLFKLCSCSSTLMPLARGLEGTLADLRWQAMDVVETVVFCLTLKWKTSERRETFNGVFLVTVCLYI
jgi:hypothetical protein